MKWCAWCGSLLSSPDGSPRWEIYGGGNRRGARAAMYICLEGCKRATRRWVVPFALSRWGTVSVPSL